MHAPAITEKTFDKFIGLHRILDVPGLSLRSVFVVALSSASHIFTTPEVMIRNLSFLYQVKKKVGT